MLTAPNPVPAQAWLTGIQHELPWSGSPLRSQWKCTRTRPISSVWISSPSGPVTVALSNPSVRGFGVRSAGRTSRSANVASQTWRIGTPSSYSIRVVVTRSGRAIRRLG